MYTINKQESQSVIVTKLKQLLVKWKEHWNEIEDYDYQVYIDSGSFFDNIERHLGKSVYTRPKSYGSSREELTKHPDVAEKLKQFLQEKTKQSKTNLANIEKQIGSLLNVDLKSISDELGDSILNVQKIKNGRKGKYVMTSASMYSDDCTLTEDEVQAVKLIILAKYK